MIYVVFIFIMLVVGGCNIGGVRVFILFGGFNVLDFLVLMIRKVVILIWIFIWDVGFVIFLFVLIGEGEFVLLLSFGVIVGIVVGGVVVFIVFFVGCCCFICYC